MENFNANQLTTGYSFFEHFATTSKTYASYISHFTAIEPEEGEVEVVLG